MQKSLSQNLAAGMVRRNSKDLLGKLTASDEAYNFMNTVKGTTGVLEEILAGSVTYG